MWELRCDDSPCQRNAARAARGLEGAGELKTSTSLTVFNPATGQAIASTPDADPQQVIEGR